MTNNARPQRSAPRSKNINGGFIFIGAVFIGICMLIAGAFISAKIGKFEETMLAKTFSDTNTFNSPSELTHIDKKYLTEVEAAYYLNISEAKMLDILQSGGINEYIKTETGYVISVKVLDNWFENEAYQTKIFHDEQEITE